MNPKNREDGMLRMKIIGIVRKNPNGLTYTEIAKETGETRYKIAKEVSNLIQLGGLKLFKIGNYVGVKIK